MLAGILIKHNASNMSTHNPANVIKFYDRYQPHDSFTNVVACKTSINIGGTIYSSTSSEGIYQGIKAISYGNNDWQKFRELIEMNAGGGQRHAAQDIKNLLFSDKHATESTPKELLMYEIVMMKLTQNPEVLKALLSTGNAKLVEDTQKQLGYDDPFWGNGQSGTGDNALGKILEKARATLLDEYNNGSIPIRYGLSQSVSTQFSLPYIAGQEYENGKILTKAYIDQKSIKNILYASNITPGLNQSQHPTNQHHGTHKSSTQPLNSVAIVPPPPAPPLPSAILPAPVPPVTSSTASHVTPVVQQPSAATPNLSQQTPSAANPLSGQPSIALPTLPTPPTHDPAIPTGIVALRTKQLKEKGSFLVQGATNTSNTNPASHEKRHTNTAKVGNPTTQPQLNPTATQPLTNPATSVVPYEPINPVATGHRARQNYSSPDGLSVEEQFYHAVKTLPHAQTDDLVQAEHVQGLASAVRDQTPIRPVPQDIFTLNHSGGGWEINPALSPEERAQINGPIFMGRLNGKEQVKDASGNPVYDILYYEKGELNPKKSFIAPDNVPPGSKSTIGKETRDKCFNHHDTIAKAMKEGQNMASTMSSGELYPNGQHHPHLPLGQTR